MLEAGDILHVLYGNIRFCTMVLDYYDEYIIIKLTNDFAKHNILQDDFIICGIEKDDIAQTYGCIVFNIEPEKGKLMLKVDNQYSNSNRRIDERYNVSLYGEIIINHMFTYIGTIKDISHSGLAFLTNQKLPLSDNINVFIFDDNFEINLKGLIVRRLKRKVLYEYGIMLVHDNQKKEIIFKKYILKIKENQKRILKSL